MGTKTRLIRRHMGKFFPCEKRIPIHGDENSIPSNGLNRLCIASCEKRIPIHGDENCPLFLCPYCFDSKDVKKESPYMGTKTHLMRPRYCCLHSREKRILTHGDENKNFIYSSTLSLTPVKKESPYMGTKTWNAQCCP